jgi:serine/threonine protein kinase
MSLSPGTRLGPYEIAGAPSFTRPASVDEVIDVCRDIAAGLGAAHESGVVHRDLKPGNVILTPSGQVAATGGYIAVLNVGIAV